MGKKNIYIHLSFLVFVLGSAATVFRIFLPFIPRNPFLGWLLPGLLLIISYSVFVRGIWKTIFFASTAWLFGFLSELVGVMYGWIFGPYQYVEEGLMFFGVLPFDTPISWTLIILMCYEVANLIISAHLPESSSNNYMRRSYRQLLSPIVAGFSAVSLDLILDPVSINPKIGSWRWLEEGPYFGVPITNFIGWFLVTFASTLLFTLFESNNYESRQRGGFIENYTPAFMYLTFLIIYGSLSIYISRSEYLLIGLASMLPFIIMSFLPFKR